MGQIIDEYGLEAALIKTKNYIDKENTAIRKGVHPGMTAGKAELANNVDWVIDSAIDSGEVIPSGYYSNIKEIWPAKRSCVWNQLFWKEEQKTYGWGFIIGTYISTHADINIKVPFDFKYGRKYCFDYQIFGGITPSIYYYNQDGEKITINARTRFPVNLEETQDGFYLQVKAQTSMGFYIHDLTLMDGPGYERLNLYDSTYLHSNNADYNEGTFLSTKVTKIKIGNDTYPFNITLNWLSNWNDSVTPNYTNRYVNIINLSDLTWSPGGGSHVYISSALPMPPAWNFALCNKFPVYPGAHIGSLQLSGNYLTYHGTETIDPTEFFKDVQLMYPVAVYVQSDVTLPEISFYGQRLINSDANLKFQIERIACSPLTYNHEEIINDLPIIGGDAENSAILKGGDNQVISKNGVALGNNNIVGLKGFYYKSIQFITSDGRSANIFISEKQVTPTIVSSSPTEGTSIDLKNYLSVGDTISIINDVKYENCATITDIFSNNSGFRVQFVGSYPFNEIKPETSLDVEDYSVYCLDKPDAGIVDLGIASFAAGRYNKATNNNATAFGFNNNAYGKFSFVEGRDNKAGYSAHAEGRENVASGEQSHAEGLSTEASGNHSHSEGQDTTASGINSHSEGNRSIASGVDSHAEGYDTKASGLRSHAEGSQNKATNHGSHVEGVSNTSNGVGSHVEGLYNTGDGRASHSEGENNQAGGDRSHVEGSHNKTTNNAEHAEGKYNKSNTGTTIHSVGIGTSETDRKNAHEISTGGKHYIYGLNGYNGTNPTSSNDLVTLLTSSITDSELDSLFND